EAVPAMAAQGERGVATTVEEEQGLLAAFERLFQRPDQRRRQPGAARRRVGEEVERCDLGKLGDSVAVGQADMLVCSDFGHLPARSRWPATPAGAGTGAGPNAMRPARVRTAWRSA